MIYGEFKTQYHVSLNPQQEAAMRQVDGPAPGGAGERQDHGAGHPPGVYDPLQKYPPGELIPVT